MLDGNPRGELVIKVTIACGLLETFAVILRLLARWRSKAAFAADDWWIVATLIPSYAMLAVGCLMVTIGGGGRHGATLDMYQVQTFLKVSHSIMNPIVLLTDLPDCHRCSNRLRLHNSHGQNLHPADVSPDLRHRRFQKGHAGHRRGMRCMGYSCSALPHIPMPAYLWNVEPRGHFHQQVHKFAGVLPGSCFLEHGT